eukprot:TRINITY_DN11029_c0_g1_i2.p1 TRINITY_DN11029_c0_g1~~TRINITY_DN11029_c0_g1_i2.p1  ORF type:complete len:577 (+),score=121.74 TRINITY_DN11029_c0_g1_i2:162-1892(+)
MADEQRILIVDESELLQGLVHAWLSDCKYPHQQVADGQHALGACNTTKFTLIYINLDALWQGAVPNGYALAQNIRSQGLNMVTPLIGMTGSTAPGDSWASTGFSDLISKPLNKDSFMAQIQQWSSQEAAASLDLDLSAVPMVDMADLSFAEFPDLDLTTRRTAKVLVVEDCTLTQHVIATLLKELTDDVTQVYDGEQAIQKCTTEHFDLIYMDIHMPSMDGVQATQHIRTNDTPNMYTPIIAFTSSGTLRDYSEYGMNDILQKPFTVDALKQQFDRWTPFGQGLDLNDPFSLPAPTTNTSTAMTLASSPAMVQPSSPLASVHSVEPTLYNGARSPTSPGGGLSSANTSLIRMCLTPPPDGVGAAMTGQQPASRPDSLGTRSRSGSDPSVMVSRMPTGQQSPLTAAKSTSSRSGSGRSKWNKKKGKNSLGHTEKEKQRRADIVNSCNNFRGLIPVFRDADKATVFRTSVDYLNFLRSKFTAEQLQQLDSEFVERTNMRQLESDSARLNIDSPIDSPADSRHNSRPESPLSGREQSPIRTASSPMLVQRGRSPMTRTHSGPTFSLSSPLAQNGAGSPL